LKSDAREREGRDQYFRLINDDLLFTHNISSLKDHMTALMLACKEKNYDFVRIMIEHTASVNSKDCVSFISSDIVKTII